MVYVSFSGNHRVSSRTRTGVVYPQKSVWYLLCPSRLRGRLFCLPVVVYRTSLPMYWYHLTDQVYHITNHKNTIRRTSARPVASLRRRLVAFFFALSSVVDPLLLVFPVPVIAAPYWTGRCARPSAVSALPFDAVPGGARGARSCGAGRLLPLAPTSRRRLLCFSCYICAHRCGKSFRSDKYDR